MNGNRETSGADHRIGDAAFRGASSRGTGAPPTVIVVGAGVSGTACAAALAGFGTRVIIVNSALDVVGLPAYGPAVETPDRMVSMPAPPVKGGVMVEPGPAPALGAHSAAIRQEFST